MRFFACACLGLSAFLAFAEEPAVLDLVVYGGSPAAGTAAIRAKSLGLEPVIVSPDGHVGGLTVSGLGYTDSGNTATIGGLAREFYRRVYDAYSDAAAWRWQRRETFTAEGQGTKAMREDDRTMWTFEPHVAQSVIDRWLAEKGIRVIRGESLDRERGVEVADRRIRSITLLSGRRLAGRYFIDATYEGDLMAAAGVSYQVGRESSAQYGEVWNGNQPRQFHHGHYFKKPVSAYVRPGDPSSGLCAEIGREPEGTRGTGDRHVQAYCYRLCMTDCAENRLPVVRPEGYDRARYELLGRVYAAGYDETFRKFDRIPNLKTDTNNHGPMNFDYIGGSDEWPEATYARRAQIAAEHRKYQQGLLYFIANDPSVPEPVRREMAKWGLAADEFVDNGGWPYHIYVREGRRLQGEYVMTEHDCLKTAIHPRQGRPRGSIGMGSYCLDSHNARRYVTAEGHVQNEGDIGVHPKGAYPIDYGAILPRRGECENLLVPVAVSASHIAFGSIRMEPVFMILGDSAATAVACALADGRALQDVDYGVLERRLLAGGQVLRR